MQLNNCCKLGSDPKSSLPVGRLGPHVTQCYLGAMWVSLPNGIPFCPMALAGCTSVTDIQTNRWTEHAQIHQLQQTESLM